jgi:8-oxo-dGTP pyrophosphatase MutT (NUDIX family)
VSVIPIRDAATVMLVRDAPAHAQGPADPGGLEVFMLRRNLRSDFVGGAYVFPGGGVDDDDRFADLEAVCAGRTDAEASAQLGVDRGGLAFWVAAVRESFEEAGVLLAYDGHDERHRDLVRFDDPATVERFAGHRAAVDRGERRLVEVCQAEGLRLAVDSMYYFAHWITPEGPTRRYDTRFFVARAPDAQVPLHDDREVIANLWVRPSQALAAHRAGEFEMIFPTVRSLVALERFDRADDLLAAAAAIGEVPAILPRIVEDEGGGLRIVLPGDPGYDDLVSASLPEGVPLTAVSAATSTDRRPIEPVPLSRAAPDAGGRRAPAKGA